VLLGSGRAEQDDDAGHGEGVPGRERSDVVAADAGPVVEAEFLERFGGRDPSSADSQLGARGVAGGHFPLEHGDQVRRIR
jgi:hypothetical protein